MLHSVIKLVILTVVFPIQANLIEPEDYFDAWWMLDEVVNVIVEEVEQPRDEGIEEMAPINNTEPSP